MPRALASSLLALALACGSSGGGTGSADEPDEEASGTSPTIGPSMGGSEDTPIDPADAPVVVVRGDTVEGGVAIVVESRGGGAARLRREVLVERRDGERWVPVDVAGTVLLRATCEEHPPECVQLVPGAELRAAPWRKLSGEAQCECEECGPVPEGQYRFVVQSCAPEGHAPHRIASEPFPVSG